MINYKFDKYLNLDLRLMQYVPSGIQSLSVGNGLTYDYNMRKSARWNRRLLKRQLLNNNEDMSRREAKNLATQNVGNYINTLGDRATSSDREWLEDRTSQYHLDDNGKLLRNKSNFWKGLAVAGSALAFTPIAGGAVAGAINWNKYDKWKPGLVTLPKEQMKEKKYPYTPLNKYSMVEGNGYLPVPSLKIPSITKPIDNSLSDNPVGGGVVTPKPEFTYAGSIYDTNALRNGFNSLDDVKAQQLELASQGLYNGKIDGLWGDATEAAYNAYMSLDNSGQSAYARLRSRQLAQGNGNTQPTKPFNINTWNAGVGSSLKWNNSDNAAVLRQKYANLYMDKLKNASIDLYNGFMNGNQVNYDLLYNDNNFIRNYDNWMKNNNLFNTTPLFGTGRVYNAGINSDTRNMTAELRRPGYRRFLQGGQMQNQDLQEQLAEMICRAAFVKIAEAAANQLLIAPKLAVEAVLKEAQSNPQKLKETLSSKEILQQAELFIALNAPLMIEVVKEKGWKGLYLAIMTLKAKQGTKLSYINSLKGICPEGYEMSYMKAGGKVCPVCKKKVKINKDCGGNAMKMHATGGISEMMNQIKTDLLACGGKMKKVKKNGEGGPVDVKKRPKTYNELEHKRLIKEFNKNGRSFKGWSPQKKDSLQTYNKLMPDDGV